jgi:hypothetical protein
VAGPPRSSIGTSGRGEPTGRPARDASARTFEHDVELEDLRFRRHARAAGMRRCCHPGEQRPEPLAAAPRFGRRPWNAPMAGAASLRPRSTSVCVGLKSHSDDRRMGSSVVLARFRPPAIPAPIPGPSRTTQPRRPGRMSARASAITVKGQRCPCTMRSRSWGLGPTPLRAS